MYYMRFHVDRRIVGERRAWLEEARVTLEEDTRGILRVFYDYDFDSLEPIQADDGRWRILHLSEDTTPVQSFDAEHKSMVLGECDYGDRRIYLVRERLVTRTRFIHVAMHEILHAVGVQHVTGDAHAIMAPIAFSRLPLHMSSSDLDAFCQTIRCATKEIQP